ncbi:uncharacterized protein [Palaemon carinicauda]|uniref:uncharacterized protein isoform X7 n=1 Tax=Palaemon carinicauda TaxID=392227 RepID=UPI0035B6A1CA
MTSVTGTPAIELHDTDPKQEVLECPGTIHCPTEVSESLECEEECANESDCTTEKQESQISFRDHDSESTSYHDARSSLSLVADLMSSQEEEIELEGFDTEVEKEEEENGDPERAESENVNTGILEKDSVLSKESGAQEVKEISDIDEECKIYSDKTNLDAFDSTKCAEQQMVAPIRGDCQSSSRVKYSNDITPKVKKTSHTAANQGKQTDSASKPESHDKCSSSHRKMALLGKVLTPGQYQSTTLGRPGRKARRVPGPVAPSKADREKRSKTEPPPELAPPDLLQISWVWESRSPTRSTSIRRRPSRRVSVRRRSRPFLTPRRASGSRGGNSPKQRFSPTNNSPFGEVREDSPPVDKTDEEEQPIGPCQKYNSIVPPPVVLSCESRADSPSKKFLPCCDTEHVFSGSTLPRQIEEPKEEVTLRKKKDSNYFQNASKALRQKWRNSEIMLPKFLTESIENLKNVGSSGSEQSKGKDFFEKAKALPLQMRKLSHLLFNKKSRHMNHLDIYLNKSEDSSPALFLELKSGLASRLVKRRKSVRRSNGVAVKRQGSFSPGNSLKRNYLINWSQRYQNVMSGRGSDQEVFENASDYGDECAPSIHVTEADEDDEAFVSGDDNVSTEGSVFLHPLQQQKGGVLGKLFKRIRARSLSTSRSFASSRSSMSGGSEDGHSPSHSSDYEDQDDNERSGSASLVGRMRGLRRDMQKKISRLKSPRGSTSSSPGPLPGDKAGPAGLPLSGHPQQQPATSSFESLPSSAPVASTTALGSNRSSLSGEEVEPYTGPFIGRARALVDCQPSPYDRDALKFKKGDIIDIIAKNPSGLWKGCVDGRVGHFKFILVEEEVERPTRRSRPWRGSTPRRGRACTLEELLTRLRLGHLIQVFVLNGYEDLEQFRDVEKADLDCLGITDPETCAKILTAVALLHDADSEPEQDLPETLETTEVALRRGDHGRDSGCYTDHRSTATVSLDENNLDTRQSTPSTDTSSGYHSRGAYNIPLGEATLTSRDDHSSALDSPSSESAPTSSTAQPGPHSEPHSYRAHLATVLPASPRAKLRQNQQDHKLKQDSQVDYEAKYVTARSVFEKELLKREVPFTVRSPKRNSESQSPTEELENEEKSEDSSVAVTGEASP